MDVKLQNLRPVKRTPYKVMKVGLRGVSVSVGVATGLEPGDRVYQYVAETGDVLLTRRELKRRKE